MAVRRSSEEEKGGGDGERSEPLIPGLPDEIAELCLHHVPFPYQSMARSVSPSWNRAITSPFFRKSPSLSLPYLFVCAFEKSTARIQWQAFDPQSRRWFFLPPMPCPAAVCPPSFACASIPSQGTLFVLGGLRTDAAAASDDAIMRTTLIYRTSTNTWTHGPPMLTPRAFFAAGSIGGRIFAVGGSGGDGGDDTISAVERYDGGAGAWEEVAKMRTGLGRYDAAVVGSEMCVTEGWTWPFEYSPRGGVYDAVSDTWREMRAGMREGWTGASVVLGDRLFVISELGDCPIKVYDPDVDTWAYVGGDKFPCERVQRPFAVTGMEGRIYVVSGALHVAIGKVSEGEGESGDTHFKVKWEVVEAPKPFHDLSPSSCHVLYA